MGMAAMQQDHPQAQQCLVGAPLSGKSNNVRGYVNQSVPAPRTRTNPLPSLPGSDHARVPYPLRGGTHGFTPTITRPHPGGLSTPNSYEYTNQPTPRAPPNQTSPWATLLVNPQTLRRFDATKGFPGEGPPPPWQLIQNLTARINPAPIDWAEVEYNPLDGTQHTPVPPPKLPQLDGARHVH